MNLTAAVVRAGGWALHLGVGTLLAWWGHAQWPLAFAGLLPLAAWLALVAALRGAQPGISEPADWAQRAARLGMLPMMAGLPTMLDLCSSAAGGLLVVAAGHGVALLMPPALMASLPARLRPERSLLCAALLLSGGLLLLAAPGVQGLMLATLAHAAAWSVAVSSAQTSGRQGRDGLSALTAFAPAISVLAMGAALDFLGPTALFVVHGALALFGLALVAGRVLQTGPEPARF